jgi:hypothetical protein
MAAAQEHAAIAVAPGRRLRRRSRQASSTIES